MARFLPVPFLVLAWMAAPLGNDAAVPGRDWPQFRGPSARGIGEGGAPASWDVPGNTGVKWKTAIPGLGHSSPIIWNDLVCVTSAISARTGERSINSAKPKGGPASPPRPSRPMARSTSRARRATSTS